jgi:hypothetical protein
MDFLMTGGQGCKNNKHQHCPGRVNHRSSHSRNRSLFSEEDDNEKEKEREIGTGVSE